MVGKSYAEDAGETPALPAGLLPSLLLREEAMPLTMRQGRPASCVFVDHSFFFCFSFGRPSGHPLEPFPWTDNSE